MIASPTRVLIIEDNSTSAQMVADWLRTSPGELFSAAIATRLASGLERLNARDIDALLLDLDLPDSSGLDTLAAVLAHSPDLPVIVLTSTLDRRTSIMAIQQGAAGFLTRDQVNAYTLAQAVRHGIEHQRLRLQLEAQTRHLRTIINSSPEGILVVGPDGDIRFLNPAAEALLGAGTADLLGQPFGHPLAAGRMIAVELVRQVNGGSTSSATAEMRTVEIEWEGEPAHLVSLRDVSEKRLHEQQIRKLSQAVEQSPVAVMITDLDGIIEYLNPRGTELTGYTLAELAGRNALGLGPESVSEQDYLPLRKAMAAGQEWHGELPTRQKSGKTWWSSTHVTPIKDADGAVTHYLSLMEDITPRRQMEAALRQQRDRAQQYLDTAGVILMALDLEGDIVLINSRGCVLLGYPEHELVGSNWFEKILPTTIRHPVGGLYRLMAAGEHPWVEHYENVVVTADGAERLIAWHNTPLRDETGSIVGVLCSGEDITERKQTEAELRWGLQVNEALSALYKPLISPASTIQEIAQTVLDQARALTGSTHGYVSAIDPLTGDNVGYTITEMFGAFSESPGTNQPIVFPRRPDGQYPGLWGYSLNTRAPLLTEQPAAHGLPEGHVELRRFLSVPVLLGEELVGQIALANADRPYAERDVQAVQRLAEFYALAIQRMRTQQAEVEQRTLAEALLDTANAINSTLDQAEVLARILSNVERVVPHDAANIMILEGNSACHMLAGRGYDRFGQPDMVGQRFELSASSGIRAMLETRQPFMVQDTHQQPTMLDVPGTQWVRSMLSAPIVTDQRMVGLLTLDSATPRFFSTEHARRLMAFANQAAIAIHNVQLYQAAAQQNDYLEQTVASRTADLRSTTEHLETLLNSVGDGLLVIDQDGYIERVNPAFIEQTGYTAQEAGARPWFRLPLVDVLPWQTIRQVRQRVAAGKVWQGELTLKRKDATSFDVVATVAPVGVEARELSSVVCSIQDITAIKEMERIKDAFVSNVSHELRTPLATVIIQLEVMFKYRDHFGPTEHEQQLRNIHGQMFRLRDLVESILELSRFDAGRVVLTLQRFDLAERCRALIDEMRPIFAHVTVSSRGGDTPCTVSADLSQIDRVLRNLLSNAAKYTPPGGQVTVAVDRRGQEAVVSVADTGIGIAPEEQAHLFKRFYRTASAARVAGGSGLGLAISSEIVALHGGRIEVQSTPGKGSTFFLCLPLADSTGE